MTLMILLMLSLFIGMHFTFMAHPLAMGLVLLIQSLMVALFSGTMAPIFWFSYVLFLVFLGGLMVLFIYVTSLASNEMFVMNPTLTLFLAPFGLMMFITILVYDSWFSEFFSLTHSNLDHLSDFLIKIYSYPTAFLTVSLILYLLLALIAVVTITKFLNGPLRLSN